MTNEPVLIAAVAAILSILVARFGVDASTDQITAVATVVAAVAAVVARHFVTPVRKV